MSKRAQERAARLRQTFLMVAVANAGVRRGIKGCQYLVMWGLCSEELGHAPMVHEYDAWANVSETTGWRQRTAFRAAFPGCEELPLWQEMRRQVLSRERGAAMAEGMSATWVAS